MNETGAPDGIPVNVKGSLDWSEHEPPVSENARRVIEKRYSQKDENGNPTETWYDIVNRVVEFVANAEELGDKYNQFFLHVQDLMMSRKFIPNTPCLVNAGVTNSGLAGCYVLPVPDSIKGIMKAASDAAIIHQSGGGTGFSFETLRPAGSSVRTHSGVASGPVSFMRIIDTVTDVVKQGGVRRGANMGIMRVDHPDILRFIDAKTNQHAFTNFNISVTVTDEFMHAVESGEWIQTKFNGEDWFEPIYDPETGKDYNSDVMAKGKIYAPDVWRRITEAAHKWGEPGIIFIDTINRHNLLHASMGDIIATNPCAEQALHPYNSCNLGSIDVAKFYEPELASDNPSASFNWDAFSDAIYWGVRFLDNVIDVADWVLPEIEDVVKRTRPVGLGIMGFADLLLKLKIKYGSEESMRFLDGLTSFFQHEAWKVSCEIGKEKGAFPEFEANKEAYTNFLWNEMNLDDLSLDQIDEIEPNNAGHFHPRNYEVTTIAPTGTISLVAETSSGIEPNFGWTTTRRDTVGERHYVHPLAAHALGVSYDDQQGESAAATLLHSCFKSLPDYFVTAHDLTAEQHLRMLATAQQHIDNGVSKTCNAHKDDTVESVDALYKLAHRLGVKAVSYYRDGSRDGQVLSHSAPTESRAATIAKRLGVQFLEQQHGIKTPETIRNPKDICPQCDGDLIHKEGCVSCIHCDFAACTVG